MQWVVNFWIMWPISFCRGRQYEQVQKGARHSWTKSPEMDTRRTEQYTLQHPWYNSFGGVKHKWRAESDQTDRLSVNIFPVVSESESWAQGSPGLTREAASKASCLCNLYLSSASCSAVALEAHSLSNLQSGGNLPLLALLLAQGAQAVS